MTLNSAEEHEHAVILLYRSGHVIAVIPQTFVYGIYAVLIPVSSYVMLHRGLVTRARKILFGMIIFMFLISTAYWITSVSTLIQLIQVWFLSVDPDAQSAPNYLPFFNALILINYILTDGVVVWRAWVLCSVDGTKVLMMCLFMLCLATVSVITTIAIRIALMIINTQTGELFNQLNHGINVTQVATLILSVLTNSLATFLISSKAWRNRTQIRDDLGATANRSARTGKMFVLLIETGVLYSLSCLTVLISTLIPLKEGTLGDLYTPVNTQLAGIYPVVVLLLITQDRTLDRTVIAFISGVEQTGFNYRSSQPQLESAMHFQRRSVLSSASTSMSEIDTLDRAMGDRYNKDKHGSFMLTLPPISSARITWDGVGESV